MKKLHTLLLGLSLIFSSCALFENDVADFMEKYTETAAIEQHTFSIETYTDAANQLCIPSDQDVEITFYMRNPKQFNLVPSVNFENLDGQISRSAVGIEQTEFAIINLTLPQDFLIPADEGKDITPLINLYEPMSGRDFDRYSVSLSCNSKPPAILNPTIINNSNSTFVVAFDMPSPEEVAVRHKDISTVEINGRVYPVTITTRADPDIEGALIAEYSIEDSHFTRSAGSNYTFIGGKEFTPNSSTSFYYETGDTFFSGDQEYNLILRDNAGLESTVKASTSISKLEKPRILDQNGYDIAEGGLASAPFNEQTEMGTITIIPPTEDHHGNPVSGTTVYYKVYEATGSGRIYTSGTTTTSKSIDLPQNTYRVEAYATLTNYENSATRTVKFRFLNNVIFVDSDNADPEADGSESSPYPTIQAAIESINDVEMRPERRNKYTIYVKGTHGDLELNKLNIGGVMQDIRTDELVITRKPNSTYTSVINSISITGAVTLQKVTIGNITISNSNSSYGVINGISHRSPVTALYIEGTTIENCNASGAYGLTAVDCAPVTITNAYISNNTTGINGENCNLTINGGKIYHNESYGLCYGGSSTTCTMTGVEVYENGYNSTDNQGIYLDAGDCTLTNCNIHNNYGSGISLTYSSICKLYGGSVKQNLNGGISLTTEGTNRLQIKGTPVVQQNTVPGSPDPTTRNVLLQAGQNIEIVGQLTSGCRVGVTTDSARTPSDIGDKFTFTSGYRTYNSSASPSNFFTSDAGFSIALDGNEAGVAKAGGSGGMGSAFDYAMTFAFENQAGTALTSFVQGEVTPLYIRPSITRDGTAVAYADIKSSINWTISLYNGGTYVSNLPVIENGSERIKVNLPSSLEGSYEVTVEANLLSIPHQGSCTLNCRDPNAPVSSPVSSLTAAPTSGTYTLGTKAELVMIKDWAAAGSTFEGVTFELTGDIDTEGEEVIIGTDPNSSYGSDYYPFKGTFDGKGHKVTNTISRAYAAYSRYFDGALFRGIDGDAVIKNLTIAGTSKGSGLIGVIKSGTVENCISEVTINNTSRNGSSASGGIAAHIAPSTANSTIIIRKCINKGNITQTEDSAGSAVAGIVGSASSSNLSGSNCIIENCINKGTITTAISAAAGIIGHITYWYTSSSGDKTDCTFVVRNCKNTGDIRRDAPSNRITNYTATIGGIVGTNQNGSIHIINCNNSGDFNYNTEFTKDSGIYCGSLFSDSTSHLGCFVYNCCNTGNVTHGIVDGSSDSNVIANSAHNYSTSHLQDLTAANLSSLADPDYNMQAFSSEEAIEIVSRLNNCNPAQDLPNWIATETNTTTSYKTWTVKNGVPELDLGELDTIANQ